LCTTFCDQYITESMPFAAVWAYWDSVLGHESRSSRI